MRQAFASIVLAFALLAAPPEARAETEVDLELVLAVDISYSMDPDEQKLQRQGYVDALVSPQVLQAIQSGPLGRIAITYVEWAGAVEQRVVVPWRLIDGPEAARTFIAELEAAPFRRAYRTSISGALLFSAPLFDDNGFVAERRVIDVSGDGTNNNGVYVTEARQTVLDRGIAINGLPIMIPRPYQSFMDIPELDIYYEDCVIGGPGAFVVPVKSADAFTEATRMKLLLEIAGRMPEPGRPIPAASSAPRIPCNIGERIWQERYERWQQQ